MRTVIESRGGALAGVGAAFAVVTGGMTGVGGDSGVSGNGGTAPVPITICPSVPAATHSEAEAHETLRRSLAAVAVIVQSLAGPVGVGVVAMPP